MDAITYDITGVVLAHVEYSPAVLGYDRGPHSCDYSCCAGLLASSDGCLHRQLLGFVRGKAACYPVVAFKA